MLKYIRNFPTFCLQSRTDRYTTNSTLMCSNQRRMFYFAISVYAEDDDKENCSF